MPTTNEERQESDTHVSKPPVPAIKHRARRKGRQSNTFLRTLNELRDERARRGLHKHGLIKSLRRREIYQEAKHLKEQMLVFRETKAINSETKARVGKVVHRLLHRRSLFRLGPATVLSIVVSMLMPVVFIISPILSLFIYIHFQGGHITGDAAWTTTLLAGAIVAILTFLLIMAPGVISSIRSNRLQTIYFLTVYPLACLIVNYYLQFRCFPQLAPKLSVLLAGALTGISWACLYASLMSILSICGIITFYNLQRIMSAQFPDAEVISDTLRILRSIERKPQNWQNISIRSLVIKTLDDIASIIERDVPHRLRSRHIPTNQWFQDSCGEIAASVREMAKWILRPMADTRDQFIARMGSILVNMAEGNWDAFERSTPVKVTKKRFIYNAIVSGLRVVVVATLPGIALGFFHHIRPSYHLPDALIGIVIVWATMAFLANLDPSFSAKVSAFKDTVQSVPFLNKSGKE